MKECGRRALDSDREHFVRYAKRVLHAIRSIPEMDVGGRLEVISFPAVGCGEAVGL
jgi:hypothetical protein